MSIHSYKPKRDTCQQNFVNPASLTRCGPISHRFFRHCAKNAFVTLFTAGV